MRLLPLAMLALLPACWRMGGNDGWGVGDDTESSTDSDADADGDSDSDTDSSTFPEPDVEPGQLLWAKRAGGSGLDMARSVAVLADGSLLVAGSFAEQAVFGPGEPGETTLVSAGESDAFYARFGFDGQLNWARRFGGSGYDQARDVAVVGNGAGVVTGYFEESAEAAGLTLESAGEADLFLFELELANGIPGWALRGGGAEADIGYEIAVTSSSIWIAAGFSGTATFDDALDWTATFDADGLDDGLLIAFDLSGAHVEDHPVQLELWGSGPGPDYLTEEQPHLAINVAEDSTIHLTGEFSGPLTVCPGTDEETTASGEREVFLAGISGEGEALFVRREGSDAVDSGQGLARHADGTLYVTGFYGDVSVGAPDSNATFGEGEPNETELPGIQAGEIFLARYEPDGQLEWALHAGSIYEDLARDVAVIQSDDQDGVAITGHFRSHSTFYSVGSDDGTDLGGAGIGAKTLFVARYSSSGELLWVNRAGGGTLTSGTAIGDAYGHSLVVVGYFTGTAVFGEGEPHETTLESAGQHDIFIAKYAS